MVSYDNHHSAVNREVSYPVVHRYEAKCLASVKIEEFYFIRLKFFFVEAVTR